MGWDAWEFLLSKNVITQEKGMAVCMHAFGSRDY